jgi:exonuclease SbcD
MLGKDLVLPKSVVALPGVDYVAMGHVHKHQALGTHPPVVYPGSIERIDFGEEHEDKGCVLVELERGDTRWQFHRLTARPFVTIGVDVRGSPDPQARVALAISKHELTGAITRVKVEARADQAAQLRTDEIRQLLEEAGAFTVAAIAVDVERAARGRLGEAGHDLLEGLTPRRALELYLRSKNTPEERITTLLAAAEELFQE